MALDWWVAPASGLIGAAVAQAFAWFTRRSERARVQRSWALRTSVALHDFAARCAAAITDGAAWTASGGYAGEPLTDIPQRRPEDAGLKWELLDTDLVSAALLFELRCQESERWVATYEAREDEYVNHERRECARRAVEALALARTIQKKNGLKCPDIPSADVVAKLKRLENETVEQEHARLAALPPLPNLVV